MTTVSSASPAARRVLVNTGWLYLDQAVRAGLTLIVFSLMARSLGPADFGRLSYALAFPGLFLPLAMLGLDHVVIRDFVRAGSGEAAAVFGTAFGLKCLASLLAWLAAMAVAAAWAPADPAVRPLVWITAASLAFQPLLTADYYFQSRVAARYSAIARMSSCVVANGVRLVLIAQHAPLAGFAAVWVGETALYGANLWVALRWEGAPLPRPWRAFDPARARRLLADAWPIALSDVAIAGYLKLDQLLLEHRAGAAELGRYAAAFRLADATQFLALALIASYYPRIVALQQGDAAEFEAKAAAFFRRMTWFALAMALALSAAAPLLARGVLGERFGSTAAVLAVLAWANVFVTQIAVRGKWFLAESLQVYSLACFACGAVAHVAGVWWLAPRFGAAGAAWSFLAAQALMALGVPWIFARTRFAGRLAWRSLVPARLLP